MALSPDGGSVLLSNCQEEFGRKSLPAMYTGAKASETKSVDTDDYEKILQRWLRERFEESEFKSITQFAKHCGAHKANVIDGMNGKRKVTNFTIVRVANGLKIPMSVALYQISQLVANLPTSTAAVKVAVRPEHQKTTDRAIEDAQSRRQGSKKSKKRQPSPLPTARPHSPSRNS